MKSIMHSELDRTCYLCMELHDDYSEQTVLEEHHVIYGHGLRKLSTKYGLLVYLCPAHHQYGPEAVHHNCKNGSKYGNYLKERAQRRFMEFYPKLDFLKIFGKNFIPLSEQNMEETVTPMTVNAQKSSKTVIGMTVNKAAGIPEGFILLNED